METPPGLVIGLVGCGVIGEALIRAVSAGQVPAAKIKTLYDADTSKAQRIAEKYSSTLKVAREPSELLEDKEINLIVEAASQKAVTDLIPAALSAGKKVMIMSAGALMDHDFLESIQRIAQERGVNIYVPSGAVAGIDAVKATALEQVAEIRIVTTKPPRSLEGAPFVVENNLDLHSFKEKTKIYEGPASEAVKLFPANVNIAATLSLAGIGPEKTRVAVMVDPSASHNVHEIYVKGAFGTMRVEASLLPTTDNPRTSLLATLSAIRKLKEITATTSIGT